MRRLSLLLACLVYLLLTSVSGASTLRSCGGKWLCGTTEVKTSVRGKSVLPSNLSFRILPAAHSTKNAIIALTPEPGLITLASADQMESAVRPYLKTDSLLVFNQPKTSVANTVAMIEDLRSLLHIHQLVLYGVSASAAIALSYSTTYQTHTLALILDSPLLLKRTKQTVFYPNIPVLVLHGQEDTVSTLRAAHLTASHFSQNTILIVPEAGHDVVATEKSACALEAIKAFAGKEHIASCSASTPVTHSSTNEESEETSEESILGQEPVGQEPTVPELPAPEEPIFQ